MFANKSPEFWKSLTVLTVPVALQMLLQSLLGMADIMMVSGLGATAVASVGLAGKLQFLLQVSMNGIAAGGSVLIAQYVGAKDLEGARRILSVTLMVGLVTIMPFTALFAFHPQWWVGLINPDQAVVSLAGEYLMITALVLVFTQVVVIFEASLRTLNETTMPLVAGAVSVCLNVFLNYVLIYGHFGAPALGVAGAAWATLIARFVQLVIIVGWVYGRNHRFALTVSAFIHYLSWRAVKRYVSFAAPLVANYSFWGLGNATYHVLTGFAGTDALAVIGVIVPLELLFFSLFIGLANASAVMVGRSLGGNDRDAAWDIYRFFDQLAIALVVVMCAALWFLRPVIVAGFDQLNEQALALLDDSLAIFALLIWVKVLNMIRIMGVLRAGGDNTFCLLTDMTVMWVIGIPLFAACVFFTELPFTFLFALLYLEEVLKAFPVARRIKKRYWMKNLTEHGDTSADKLPFSGSNR